MENSETKLSKLQEFVRSVQLIHLALVLGLSFFTIVSAVLIHSNVIGPGFKNMGELFLIVNLVFATVAFFLSKLVFNKRVEQMDKHKDLAVILSEYRASLIIKFAIIEGSALLAIIFYILTGDYYNLITAGLLIILLLFNRPDLYKITQDLKLEDNINR